MDYISYDDAKIWKTSFQICEYQEGWTSRCLSVMIKKILQPKKTQKTCFPFLNNLNLLFKIKISHSPSRQPISSSAFLG